MTNNVLELLISGGTVDLDTNFKVQLNYSIAEIQDISKKNSNYSKQFKIAGTKNNHTLFKNIFEINNDSEYDPNKKVDAQLLNNTLPILCGYLQLKKINHNLKNEIIDYECVMYGGAANLLSAINGSYLSDLDFSFYDHQYNHTEITSSWYHTWINSYVYPMVDWNAGYTLQTINQQNDYSIKYQDYTPALFIKNIWNKVFDYAGFTYNSDSAFFNSDRFERLILLGSPKLLQGSIEKYFKDNLYFKAADYVNLITYNNGTVTGDFPMVLPVEVGNNFSGNTFTATEFGEYKFHYNLFVPPSPTNFTLYIKLNGFNVWNAGTINAGVSPGQYEISTSFISLAPGDVLEFFVYLITNTAGIAILQLAPGSYLEMEAVYGQKYKLNEVFNKISLTEIVKSIISMFNLYLEVDPENDRNYIIATRDEYYANGRIIDWTSKLDTSTDLEEELLPELQNKNILFSYQDDQDYFNANYKNTANETYGQELIRVDNDFLKDDSQTLIQPSFAATPLVSLQGSQKIIIPKIYNISSEGALEKFNSKNRILYFQGALPCEPYYIKISANTTSSASNVYFFRDEYGAAGHFDSNQNPQFDLNFGMPQFTYINQINSYSAATGTTGYIFPADNLYNNYWENTINEITDKNSRLITAKFYLKPSDINNLRFSDSIYVKDTYYKLNKVVYNPLEDECSSVELIKSANNIPERRYRRKGTIKAVDDVTSLRINVGYDNEILHPHNIVVGRSNLLDRYTIGNITIGNSHDIKNSKNTLTSGIFQKVQGDNSVVIGGSGNTISVPENAAIIQANDSIISGLTNSFSVILSGKENKILRSQYSSIIGGVNNSLTDSIHSSIFISTESSIENSATRNIIIGGYRNYSSGRMNFTLGSAYATNRGIRNFVANSVYSSVNGNASSIIGGKFNSVNSAYSFSIGGSYNTIETATPNVILLGVNGHYASHSNTTVTQGKQVLDLAGIGDRLVYAQSDGLLQVGIAISALTSGGTIIISGGSSSSGITSVVSTGGTHGILLKQLNGVAYLKSLSGINTNILIASSTTENTIALNNNVQINNFSATTKVFVGANTSALNSKLAVRANGSSIDESLIQVRSTGSTAHPTFNTYELLRLNANGLMTVGQSLANWAGDTTKPDLLQYQNFSQLFNTSHTISTLLVSEERPLGNVTGSNVVMMVNGQSGNEGVNNTALWVRANLIGDNTFSNNVLVLEDTNYVGQNTNYNSGILKVIGGQSGVAKTGMTISRGLLTSFGSPTVDTASEVFIQSINRGNQSLWNILKLSDSANTEVFRVRADSSITALSLTGTGTNNIVISNAGGTLSTKTLTGSASNNLVLANASGVLSTIPFTGATSGFTLLNITNNNSTNYYNITGSTSLSALTVGNLTVTGTSVLSSITATTYYSGSTPLSSIFSSTAHTHQFATILNTGHTHSVSDLINWNYNKNFASSRTIITSSSAITEEILATVIISGGTLSSGDSIDVVARFLPSAGSGTKITRVRIGSGATLTNATSFSQISNTSVSVTYAHKPTIVVMGNGTLEGLPGDQASQTGAISSGVSTVNADPANNIYIHFTSIKTSADTMTLRYYDVRLFKA